MPDERARGCGFGLGRAAVVIADVAGVAALGTGAGVGVDFGIGAGEDVGRGGADDFAVAAALGAPRLGLSLNGSFSASASSTPGSGML